MNLLGNVCFEHVSCFPGIGDVTVQSIKVRRKAMYYHLSDSMLVRTAFDGIEGTWFLQMDMTNIGTNGTLAGGNGNKREEGVTGGPLSLNVPLNADSNIKINNQSLVFSVMPSLSGQDKSTGGPSSVNVPVNADLNININDQSLVNSVMPSLSGQGKSPRSLVFPSNNVLLITDLNDETSKDSPHEKKKRKKKKRKEFDEHHNEIDVDACEPKNSALGIGLSHKSNESGLALGEKANNYQEKLCSTRDKSPGPKSAVNLASKAVGDSTNENHVEMDSGVPTKENKINSHQRRKKMRKDDLSVSEFGKTEVIHSIEKQKNGDIPEEEPEHDLKCVAKELKKESASKETSPPENAVEIVSKCLPTGGRILNSNKKRPHKAGSSKVKSSKDGVSSSELKIEEASVIPGNFVEGDSLLPYTNKRTTSSKKGSVKESSKRASHEVDPPTTRPPSLERQSLAIKHPEASYERATSDASFTSKATQEELTNTEGRHTTRKNRRRKIQKVDTADHSLVELSKDISLMQKNKLKKQNGPEIPQAAHSDKGNGNLGLPCIEISPDLQTSKSSHDHQIAEIHNQDISNDNEIKYPKQGAGKKGTVDHLGANSHSVQHKASGDDDNSVKEVNANQATSDDSTEEDTPFNETLYRVAMRKNVSKVRPKKDLNQLKQEASPNAKYNIFGHFTNSCSEDEVEGHNEIDVNENVIDDSTSDGSEEDLQQTQVVLGPKALKGTSSQGASPSTSRLLHKKEVIDNDILPSQISKADDDVKLGVLLRRSHSYRKAKTTTQSPTHDAENKLPDVVPETQSDSP